MLAGVINREAVSFLMIKLERVATARSTKRCFEVKVRVVQMLHKIINILGDIRNLAGTRECG
jgi:hypothetical protein